MPCQCGYPDGMSPRGRMEPDGKPSSRGEIAGAVGKSVCYNVKVTDDW